MIDLDAIKQRRDAAMQMVSDLCHGKREWIMRIPAEPDYDPDLVIAASLGDNAKLIAEVERLRIQVAELEARPTVSKTDIDALVKEDERLQRIEAAARAHLAAWESGDTMAHGSRAALKQALEGE